MACIYMALFMNRIIPKRLTESIIHSYTVIPMEVSYFSSHGCPGEDRRKRGNQFVPTDPPTTTNNR